MKFLTRLLLLALTLLPAAAQAFIPAATTDAFDRPYKVTDAWGNTLTHGYDAQGNRTSTTAGTLASSGGSLTSTTFDQLNRPTAQTGPGGTTHIGYDKSSPRRLG